ncbi:MAG: N-6 DNA methylase, partial [bacterium]|nr:N-6 DNA methylase [bacterium]
MDYREEINSLGFNSQNGLYFCTENKWKNKFPKRTEEVIRQKIKPYAIHDFNGEPFVLFFDKPQPTEIHKWCWNLNSTPLVIIREENQLKIYNGLSINQKDKLLKLILDNERKRNDFSYIDVVSGTFLEKHGNKYNEENRVDHKLLENIWTAREILITQHHLKSSIVNGLIGRLLFVRYLIDRKVKLGKYGTPGNRELLDILTDRDRTYKLFSYLRLQFNGNLFPIDEESESVVNETHLDVFIRLLKGEELETGQMNLFEFYDFSVIPIEFVSNIYEFFLGSEKQRKQGAYYTPPFLVDYILNQTVDVHFQKEQTCSSCKVLDPACGSGIFLVETLRRLIHRYRLLNPRRIGDKAAYREDLKKLLRDNIFGIDKDRDAIQVAIFSLYITLLDYQEPKEIENFKFPELIGHNFFHSDFFATDAPFNERLKKNGFDFILGNPPWGNPAAKTKKESKEKHFKYIAYYKTRKIKVGENEISQAFMARCGDFSNEKTHCALIVTSKNLYNIDSRNFRNYFFSRFKVHRIFELSSVRKTLFRQYRLSGKSKHTPGAVGPAAVLFFQWAHGQSTDETVVKHISLKPNIISRIFRTFLIEKYDGKEVLQKYFKEYDWLFKVLVYGNILDFYFIKHLKENHPSIMEIIDDKDRFAWGRGVSKKGGDENDARFLLDRYFVDTKKKMLQPFHVDLREDIKWNTPVVHRPRRPVLYSHPMLLVKKGTAADFKVTSAVCDQDVAFTDSLTSIKAFNKEDRDVLELLSGLFYSNLFSYYNICIGSSAGIEREQSHDKN